MSKAFYGVHQITQVRKGFAIIAHRVERARPFQQIRSLMRKMGDLAGVEIEPEQQTRLLDRSIEQAGVIGGGVPGGQSCFFTF